MLDILVTCKALDEGLNVPNTTVGVIVASTKSIRQRIQRMGRILRTADNKEKGTIISLYTDNEEDVLQEEAHSLSEICEISWYGVVAMNEFVFRNEKFLPTQLESEAIWKV